jgi:NAD-dependent SIR2 family protein deacetylase
MVQERVGDWRSVWRFALAGAKMVVVNAEPTRFDELAEVVIRAKSGEVLPEIVELVAER